MKAPFVFLISPLLCAAPLAAQSEPEKQEGSFKEEWQQLFDDWKKPEQVAPDSFLQALQPRRICSTGRPPFFGEGRTYGKNSVSRLQQAWRDGGKWKPAPDRAERAAEGTNVAPPTWVIGLMVEPIEPFVRKHLGLDIEVGMRVNFVSAARPATKAGIRVDDILYRAGGYELTSLEDLKREVDRAGRRGLPLKLEWIHNGQRRNAELRPVHRVSQPLVLKRIEPVPPHKEISEIPLELDREQEKLDELQREFENQKFELKK